MPERLRPTQVYLESVAPAARLEVTEEEVPQGVLLRLVLVTDCRLPAERDVVAVERDCATGRLERSWCLAEDFEHLPDRNELRVVIGKRLVYSGIQIPEDPFGDPAEFPVPRLLRIHTKTRYRSP